jgi:hypothetical protein
MKKGTIRGLVVFILVAGLIGFLTTQLYLEFYPGTSHEIDGLTEKAMDKDRSVSLKAVIEGTATLNVMGYLWVGIINLLLPFTFAWLAARRSNKKAIRKAMVAAHIPNSTKPE